MFKQIVWNPLFLGFKYYKLQTQIFSGFFLRKTLLE